MAEIPRVNMTLFMFDTDLYVPTNFFAGAATGGRPLGRALLLWEDGLLGKWYQAVWALTMVIFFVILGGPANSSTWFVKGAILERVFLHHVLLVFRFLAQCDPRET